MNAKVVAEIDNRLHAIIVEENVRIPWAIESGSRAWGFPSPDSDYDCRFVFIRPLEDVAALFPKRDVIEMPITPIFDVGGWELGKALKLLLKGNAVIIEWLTSPIVYNGDTTFQKEFLELADHVSDRGLIANHYLRLAISMRDKTLKDNDEVPLKKLFYILRPLMALDWLRTHPNETVAPMNFNTLSSQVELHAGLRACIDDLIQLKSKTKELGQGVMPSEIRTFLNVSFERAERNPMPVLKPTPEKQKLLEAFHLKWVTAGNRTQV